MVALMDLGRGFHSAKGNPHTSSVLYAIIVISALIILAAIPMLLRARRITRDAPAARRRARGANGECAVDQVRADGRDGATALPSGSPRNGRRCRTRRWIASGCAALSR